MGLALLYIGSLSNILAIQSSYISSFIAFHVFNVYYQSRQRVADDIDLIAIIVITMSKCNKQQIDSCQ